MRPGQRATEDEKRIKARKDRHIVMPGPGTYSPVYMSSSKEALAGSSAFKSKMDREKPQPSTAILNQTGDPGAYEEPKAHLAIASTAKVTARTVGKAGKDGFGGTEKRTLLMSNMATKPPTQGWTGSIEDTPGPAAYDSLVDEKGREHSMHKQSGSEKMKSSSFASTSAQRGKWALPQQSNLSLIHI